MSINYDCKKKKKGPRIPKEPSKKRKKHDLSQLSLHERVRCNISTSLPYATNYQEIEGGMTPLFEFDEELLLSYVRKDDLCLDAMMGPGRITSLLAKKNIHVVGNDINPHMLEAAKKELGPQNTSASLTNFDVCDLSAFRSNSFDLVSCLFGALGMIPKHESRKQALRELHRVTKPGGLLLCHAHNRIGNFLSLRYLKWTLRTYFNRPKGEELGDHFYQVENVGEMVQHIFSPKELARLAVNTGFKIERKIFLSRNQGAEIKGPLASLRSAGMIFVLRKPTSNSTMIP